MLEPAHVIELFNTSKDIQTYKAGDNIFEIGATGDVMYGVIEGEVDLMLKGDVFETIKTGDVFGEGALVRIPQSGQQPLLQKSIVSWPLSIKPTFSSWSKKLPYLPWKSSAVCQIACGC
jgi:signal-transduction protein with cAMP-binding, CBS, and nucleotidyltransferase domain